MDEAEIEQYLTDRLMPRSDLRDRGAWTELFVGPEGMAVFAVHKINDSKRDAEGLHVVDHAFRYLPAYASGFGDSWESDFPDECPHWLAEFERWQQQGIQGVSLEVVAQDFDHFTLFEFATCYPIHDEYEPRVVQLFDASVVIPIELARLLALEPGHPVCFGVLPPSIRLFVERVIDADLPLSASERVAVLDPLRTWREQETFESMRWLSHALMSVLFVTGPYLSPIAEPADL